MTAYSKKALTDDLNQDIRVLSFRILRNVTLPTPVLSGRAKGNWQIGISVAPTSQLTVTDKSGALTINQGLSNLKGVKNFEAVWITNNLPYIVPLNNGTSTQAPKKFVETGIKRALND